MLDAVPGTRLSVRTTALSFKSSWSNLSIRYSPVAPRNQFWSRWFRASLKAADPPTGSGRNSECVSEVGATSTSSGGPHSTQRTFLVWKLCQPTSSLAIRLPHESQVPPKIRFFDFHGIYLEANLIMLQRRSSHGTSVHCEITPSSHFSSITAAGSARVTSVVQDVRVLADHPANLSTGTRSSALPESWH
jgi:hypothetical protein